jgi:hypothetical protein
MFSLFQQEALGYYKGFYEDERAAIAAASGITAVYKEGRSGGSFEQLYPPSGITAVYKEERGGGSFEFNFAGLQLDAPSGITAVYKEGRSGDLEVDVDYNPM